MILDWRWYIKWVKFCTNEKGRWTPSWILKAKPRNEFYFKMVCFICVQVPFIAFYRKEHIDPELDISDLWKVYHWDEKVCSYKIYDDLQFMNIARFLLCDLCSWIGPFCPCLSLIFARIVVFFISQSECTAKAVDRFGQGAPVCHISVFICSLANWLVLLSKTFVQL